jgi:hypothetical protein
LKDSKQASANLLTEGALGTGSGHFESTDYQLKVEAARNAVMTTRQLCFQNLTLSCHGMRNAAIYVVKMANHYDVPSWCVLFILCSCC